MMTWNETEKNEKDEGFQRPFVRKERYVGRWQLSELFLLGGIFSLGVLILVIHLMTWGVTLWEESERMVEGTCVVKNYALQRRVGQHHDVLYRPKIQIEYSVRDESFLIWTYDRWALTPDQGFIYPQTEAENIFLKYPLGQEVSCWYDESDPKIVVLKRESLFWGWIFLIIPVTLIVFGATGLLWRSYDRSHSKEQRAIALQQKTLYPSLPDEQGFNESPGIRLTFRLPIMLLPTFQIFSALILTILWNVCVWCLLIYLFSTQQTWQEFCLTLLFGGIFGGAGLVFAYWIVKHIRSAFYFGSTILEISDHPILPGRKYRLTLIQNGWIQASQYSLFLVCEEVARYRQGTDTITNRTEVIRNLLWEKTQLSVARGKTMNEDFFLQLPLGAMHSVKADHNEIRWKIEVRIAWNRQTVHVRECPIIVLPLCCRKYL